MPRTLHGCTMVLALLGMMGCAGGGGGGGVYVGNGLEHRLTGRVVALERDGRIGEPLAGVTVRIGDIGVTTGADGYWVAPRISAEGLMPEAVINYSRQGYSSFTQVVPASSGRDIYLQTLLAPVTVQKRIAVSQGGILVADPENRGKNEATLTLPPDFADFDVEEVDISMTLIRPQIKHEYERFPGLFVGVSPGLPSGSDLIRTFGMVNVGVSVDGQPIERVEMNQPARMQLRLDGEVGAEFQNGDTIPTWWLDEKTGLWQGEGFAQVVFQDGERYAQWQVSHFTNWNADQPLSQHACLAVKFDTLSAEDAAYIGQRWLLLQGADYSGWSTPIAFDASGMAVVTGWRTHNVRLYFSSTGSPYYWNTPPPPDVILPMSSQEGNIPAGTFALPSTNASGYRNVGPNGQPLNPMSHCGVIRRKFGYKQGVVEGFVRDDQGNPVNDVSVNLVEFGLSATPNPDGHYEFEHVPWSSTAAFQMTVSVSNSASRPELEYFPITITRDSAHNRVDFGATLRKRGPSIIAHILSDTEPGHGMPVDFEIVASDDDPVLEFVPTVVAGQIIDGQTAPVDGGLNEFRTKYRGTWQGVDGDVTEKIQIQVTDPEGNAATVEMQVAWRNHTPVLAFDVPQRATADDRIVIQVSAADPDQDPLSVSWSDSTAPVVGAAPSGVWPAPTSVSRAPVPAAGIELILPKHGRSPYTMYIDVEASDGLATVVQQRVIVVDPKPITPPQTVLTETPPSSMLAADVQFSFESPDSDVDHFECSLDGAIYAVCFSPTQLTGVALGYHTFYVRAVDADGTPDPTPSEWSWTISGSDTTPPETTIDAAPSSMTGSTSAAFAFSSADADVTGFECRLDYGVWTACASPLDMTGLSYTSYTLEIRAVDSAANRDPSPAQWTWTIVPPPDTQWNVAPPFYLADVSTTVSFWSPSASEAYFECSLDGTAYTACPSPWLVDNLNQGVHTLDVRAVGFYGNPDPSPISASWIVDTIEPDTMLSAVPPTMDTSASPVFAFDSPDPDTAGYRYECQIDMQAFLQCNSPRTFANLSSGLHELAVRAVDAAGNRDSTPVSYIWEVTGITGVRVSASALNTCGLRADGSVACWGRNDYAQIGNGQYTNNPFPQAVSSANSWAELSVGEMHVCSLSADRFLSCWGRNLEGQIGFGTSQGPQIPFQIESTGGWSAVAAGQYYTCALKLDGRLFCWGATPVDLDGDSLADSVTAPAQAGAATDWSGIAAGAAHTCATRSDGSIYCAGANASGQLGDGTTTARATFGRIGSGVDWGAPSAGQSHTCALRGPGRIYCWGLNNHGQLGDGTTATRTSPVLAGADTDWIAVSAAGDHTCGLKANGTLHCWGANANGQAGNGLTADVLAPQMVGADMDWIAMDIGQDHTCAMKAGNALYCWGRNADGQLGDGTAVNRLFPTPITGF